MSKTVKKFTILFLVVFSLLIVNIFALTAGAATVDSADSDVNVFFYDGNGGNGSSKIDEDRGKIDGGKIPGSGAIAGIIEPSVEFINGEKIPGKLPATGSDNVIIVAMLGASAFFIIAYFKSEKKPNA